MSKFVPNVNQTKLFLDINNAKIDIHPKVFIMVMRYWLKIGLKSFKTLAHCDYVTKHRPS